MPSTDEWIRNVVCTCTRAHTHTHTHTHTHRGILFSHKKEKILSSAATWMDVRGIMLSKISQINRSGTGQHRGEGVKGTN